MRILGIDHGDARIGIAISDDLGMLAHPVETIHVREVADPVSRIAEIARDRGVRTVVVGLPLNMDGSEGPASEKVRAFIETLKPALPKETVFVALDERLSTVAAQAQLHASGRTAKNSKSVIDQAAACVILQDYLDQQAAPPELPEP